MGYVAIQLAAIITAYVMAEKRGRDVRYAVVGGLLFGWLAPLYYLIVGKKVKAVELDNLQGVL